MRKKGNWSKENKKESKEERERQEIEAKKWERKVIEWERKEYRRLIRKVSYGMKRNEILWRTFWH